MVHLYGSLWTFLPFKVPTRYLLRPSFQTARHCNSSAANHQIYFIKQKYKTFYVYVTKENKFYIKFYIKMFIQNIWLYICVNFFLIIVKKQNNDRIKLKRGKKTCNTFLKTITTLLSRLWNCVPLWILLLQCSSESNLSKYNRNMM